MDDPAPDRCGSLRPGGVDTGKNTAHIASHHADLHPRTHVARHMQCRMGVDYVDIFYSHRFEETMGALDTAVRSGKALYAGISSYGPDRTREAAAAYFAAWSADELAGAPASALCRRCGQLLAARIEVSSSHQLHERCRPSPRWPQP